MSWHLILISIHESWPIELVRDEKTVKAKVSVIAATNKNFRNKVAKGNFKEDLIFRLNVFSLEVSPLGERGMDILLLAIHFLKRAEKKFNQSGIKLSKANLILMENYKWLGNIRELQNVNERAAIISKTGRLSVDLPDSLSSKKLLNQKRVGKDISMQGRE